MGKRSKHEKSEHKLQQLPRCSKCKIEFVLVAVSYNESKDTVLEWECSRCHKIVPYGLLKEGPLTKQDTRLAKWNKIERDKRRSRNKAL